MTHTDFWKTHPEKYDYEVRMNKFSSDTVWLMTRKTESSKKFWMSFPRFTDKGEAAC